MARALTPKQKVAADFLASVYTSAATRPHAGTVVESMARWIDPDSTDAESRATLASVVSDAVQRSSLTIYGLQAKIDYYKAQLREFMPIVQEAARTWMIHELTRQEIKVGQIQLFVRNRLHDVHVAARGVHKVVTGEKFTLPTTTPAQMRDITGESRRGGVMVTRLTRVQYMWAVQDAREKIEQQNVKTPDRTREAEALDHLFYLMVHPRGVEMVQRFANSPGTGWPYANETFNETLDAIRILRADIASGDTVVWNFPPAVTAGVAELGRGGDKALTGFALAWSRSRKNSIETALDIAGNVLMALALVGGPLNVISEVLDFSLSLVQTAVLFVRDVEQDQAAIATAFADEHKRLSKGPRRLGTVLQGAATIIQALALPATVSAIAKSGKRVVQTIDRAPSLPGALESRAINREINRETIDATSRGIAVEARKVEIPATGKPVPAQRDVPQPKQSWLATAADPKADFEVQRLANGSRQIARPSRFGSKAARRLGSTVPELPILPRALDNYSKKEIAEFFRANQAAYPPHIREMIDRIPGPKQRRPKSLFERIDDEIKKIHTMEANRMAGFANAREKPFVNSVRSMGNEGSRFSSLVTDNKILNLHGQLKSGGIVEFDSVRFAEAFMIETKMSVRLDVLTHMDQMLHQAMFVKEWEKWSFVRWEIWDPDPDMALLLEGIRVTLPDKLPNRIQIVRMQ